ncbi:MAG: 4Fe-4S dicluster domain-containing protein [Clostridiales bacterium]|nr:4Fe-4S dicluster domain-containing protein [Clostridiales bacterium]
MPERYLGESIPKLGFGYMRLPKNESGGFDMPQICKMVDTFLESGFTYFDTAFVYQGSEEALRESLIERYPRENYQIASKLNLMFAEDRAGMREQFETTLSRLGTSYLDFYLLHGLSNRTIKKAEELDAWNFVLEFKAEGKVRHLGFSFHGTPDELEDILTNHAEAEFVQLQINYLDWESSDVQSRKLYEIARAHNTPIIVMEPLLGGNLASCTMPWSEGLKKADPENSVASWAFRFLAELDGIITILSGMSTYEQLVDNVKTFKNLKPLTDADRNLIKRTIEEILAVPRVPCTECRYCIEECPVKINIPEILSLYNEYLIYDSTVSIKHSYNFVIKDNGRARDCIACRKCEEHCPQHIEIADYMAKFSSLVE